MNDLKHDIYVAIHRRCGDLLAAVVMDPERPQDWAPEVARWSRWKNPPEIRLAREAMTAASRGFQRYRAATRPLTGASQESYE